MPRESTLKTRRAAAGLLAAALATALPFGASAQDAAWPSKPIRVVLGQTAGGAPDILTRILAERAGQILGQPIVVDYKPSGGGVVAQDTVAKAPADGHTWLLATPTMMAVTPYIKRRLPFDPYKDFTAISLIAQTANVLVVGPRMKATSPAELVQYAKQHPTEVQYASAGLGSTAHLAGELLAASTGTQLLHIPYKGAGQALNDVVAGQVHFMITSPAAAKMFMESGRLKALATTGAQPDPQLPQLPLLGDTVRGYQIVQWWGIALRSGTPDPIARKVHAAVVEALRDPRVKDLFQAQGVVPQPTSMAEFEAFIKAERVRYQDLIKRANVPMED